MELEVENNIEEIYDLMKNLHLRMGGYRKLKICTGRMDWPEYGIYFFLIQMRKEQIAINCVLFGSEHMQ